MNREHDLTRLRNLSAEKPTTKMGQVRWVWPEIQVALAAGHTLQLVHKRLNEVGIEISYRTLSLYIGRLEREQAPGQTQGITAGGKTRKAEPSGASAVGLVELASEAPGDPFANIRWERGKKKSSGFDYDAFSTNKNLLE
jgi:hypothetical protein